MTLHSSIAQSFLELHPREAARVLETMPDEVVQGLLETTPARIAAGVLEETVPSTAVRHLAGLPRETTSSILSALSVERAADLLRSFNRGERSSLLEAVEGERRRAVERLLRYPKNTAGALMEPRVVSFRQSRRAGEVVAELPERGSELRYYVYVVNDELVLVGALSFRQLVAAPADAPLRSIMRAPVQSLSARAGRSAILRHPGWKRFPLLPVVDERGGLVGVFRYETFRNLQKLPAEDPEPGALGLALALGELFWLGASGLFRGLGKVEDER